VTAWVDTNVLVRHLTGDPPAIARRATRFLGTASSGELLLADLVLAEVVDVLESVYELGRAAVADAVRAIVTFPAIAVQDSELLLRAIEVYETHRLDYAEAYLVASAERSGVQAIASFDKTIRRVVSVELIQP
jgi:predicted nucleic-acid-binding protein